MLDLDGIGAEIREQLSRLEAALADLVVGEGIPPGFDTDRFIAPGVPRVRPLLVFLSARAAAASTEGAQALRSGTEHVAIAAELLHLAIVLHDAALGRQGGRRRRTARRLIGGAVGWLGGNHLTLRALELARYAPTPEIVGDLLDALREVTDMQSLAQRLSGRTATADEAMALADGRSGAVFSFACRAGARLGGANRRGVTELGRYGRHAGVAWQLAEDHALLDLEGEELVRNLGDRSARGRSPFSVSVAAEQDRRVAEAWRRLAHRPDLDIARYLVARVRESGALSVGRKRLALETWTARQALADLAPSAHRDALDRFAAALTR